jgi:hypothetical protein
MSTKEVLRWVLIAYLTGAMSAVAVSSFFWYDTRVQLETVLNVVAKAFVSELNRDNQEKDKEQ